MNELITRGDAQYALEVVKAICTNVGPGLPGTPQERERAAMIHRELESHLEASNVAVEEFTFAPGAFLSAYPLSALFMLIAVLFNVSVGHPSGVSPWLTAAATLAFSILSPLTIILQFILNYELVDRFFPKKQSINVIGRLLPPGTKDAKRLLILSGHHDSAPENTWFRLLGDLKRRYVRNGRKDRAREEAWLLRLGYVFYFLSTTWFFGYIILLGMSLIQLAGVITGNVAVIRAGTLGWVLLVYPIVPSIIFSMFFTWAGKNGGNVPGAVDNLSACAITTALCRFLVKNPSYVPPETEIRFISFGSEEAGLRGSRAYVARHLDELQRLDARLLNFETIADPKMVILTSEGNGAVKVSPEMVKSAVSAAERAGVPYQMKSPWLGASSDAAPFSQAGLKATTICPFRMPQHAVEFYHQRWDCPEVLTLEPLLNALKLALEWVRCGGKGGDELTAERRTYDG